MYNVAAFLCVNKSRSYKGESVTQRVVNGQSMSAPDYYNSWIFQNVKIGPKFGASSIQINSRIECVRFAYFVGLESTIQDKEYYIITFVFFKMILQLYYLYFSNHIFFVFSRLNLLYIETCHQQGGYEPPLLHSRRVDV